MMKTSAQRKIPNIFGTSLISLCIIFLSIAALGIFPSPAHAIPSAADIDLGGLEPPAEKILLNVPEPEISIPFVTLSPSFVEPKSGELISPWIGEYAAGVYQFLLSIVGVVAGVFLMIGGFTYLTAGGSAERAAAGKRRIVNAITGLILAFGSYVILFTINPGLVEFEGLRIESVDTKIAEFEAEIDNLDVVSEDLTESSFTSTIQGGTGKVPWFGQFIKKKWGPRKPNDGLSPAWTLESGVGRNCSTIASRGCGTTSLAMVLKYYGYDVTPLDTAIFGLGCEGGMPAKDALKKVPKVFSGMTLVKHEYYRDYLPNLKSTTVGTRQGLAGKSIATIQKTMFGKTLDTDASYQENPSFWDEAVEHLKNGNPLIIGCRPCVGYKLSGATAKIYKAHYMVAAEYNAANDTIIINDPGANRESGIRFMNKESWFSGTWHWHLLVKE